MKKIIVNRIEEYKETYLKMNIDIARDFENIDIKQKRKNYEYVLELSEISFFHIGNSWLPFDLELSEQYKIYVKDNNSIKVSNNLYTNIFNGMDISEFVILYGKNINQHLLAKCEDGKVTLEKGGNELQEYFKSLFDFYETIFNRKIICNIYVLDTGFQAVAFPKLIILNKGYLSRPLTYLYKFSPHESFHMVNGCYLKYSGEAKEWMRESFVEYLQLLYIKKSLGTKFFMTQLEEYRKLESIWNTCGISISNFKLEEHIKFYKYVIYGRGVMVFYGIFGEQINLINKFIHCLYSIIGHINIEVFIENMEKVTDVSSEDILKEINIESKKEKILY